MEQASLRVGSWSIFAVFTINIIVMLYSFCLRETWEMLYIGIASDINQFENLLLKILTTYI